MLGTQVSLAAIDVVEVEIRQGDCFQPFFQEADGFLMNAADNVVTTNTKSFRYRSAVKSSLSYCFAKKVLPLHSRLRMDDEIAQDTRRLVGSAIQQ